MAQTILQKDTELKFPHLLILRASAGSGKTYNLSLRFVQMLLSAEVPNRRLRNILAMTFSNNSAKEMRERILLRLKEIAIGQPDSVAEVLALVSLSEEELRLRAAELVSEIISHYADFQVMTIDSFTTALFQASALEFGFSPEFEILLDNRVLTEYAFERYLRRVSEASPEAELIEDTISRIMVQRGDNRYLWDPSNNLLDEIRELAKICASRGRPLMKGETAKSFSDCANRIAALTEKIKQEISISGLELNGNSSYSRSDIPAMVSQGRMMALLERSFSTAPVKLPKKAAPGQLASYDRIVSLWTDIGETVGDMACIISRTYFDPYVSVYNAFNLLLETEKRRQAKVFIEDINGHLARSISDFGVPDIYFRTGDVIHHFFIDEFQDTSPVQWMTLYPLLDNAVSGSGSIFLVGDTKQAIYGFRDADYRIMSGLCRENPFSSADFRVAELELSYRSAPAIVEFNRRLFHNVISAEERYAEAAAMSGLDSYHQRAKADCGVAGYVSVQICEKEGDTAEEQIAVLAAIRDVVSRGYGYGDIAILTHRNESAVQITGWLNEQGISFVSMSSLDIRRRAITSEIFALLRFLDKPTDNLAFSTFIMGTVFARADDSDINTAEIHEFIASADRGRALYKVFEERYPEIWERMFSRLFAQVGYLPLFDLVSQLYHVFNLFNICCDEEATLMRLLETVKEFEGKGYNSLSEFLEFAESDDSSAADWQISDPAAQDAVKVMTIHKAKGLDFPVTIAVIYEAAAKSPGRIIEDSGDGISLLRVTSKLAERSKELEQRYAAARLAELVNSLNTLYVGLTRPEDELHIIGVCSRRDRAAFPVDLLARVAGEYGARSAKAHVSAEQQAGLFIGRTVNLPFSLVSDSRKMSISGQMRGEVLHEILSLIINCQGDPLVDITKAATDLAASGRMTALNEKHISDLARFLCMEEAGLLFSQLDGREIYTEYEITASDGRLYRIDRLIIDKDCITAIEFKTGYGEQYEPQHERQIANYVAILRECFSDMKITGMLCYIDRMEIRSVEC